MAYKGRRVKKIPIYKKPAFWVFTTVVLLILVLTIWVVSILGGGEAMIRKPDPTTEPTSMTRPTEEAPLPPPPKHP